MDIVLRETMDSGAAGSSHQQDEDSGPGQSNLQVCIIQPEKYAGKKGALRKIQAAVWS